MLKGIEILKAACGADENGIGKAIIKVESKYMNFVNNTQKVEEEMTLATPVINISKNMRHTLVDVIFENASDYDLVQLFEMLKRATTLDKSVDEENPEVHTIQVTIVPKELMGLYFMTGFHASWMLTSSQVNRLPNTIRFFFDNDTFNTYNMPGAVDEDEE